MHIQKKQLLGFGGLALVAGITAVAYNLPTSATSAGGDVDVIVQVYNTNFETKIDKPLDGDRYTKSVVNFKETHSKASKVNYYLTYYNEDGTETVYSLSEYDVDVDSGDPDSGVTQFTLDLNNYGGWGAYKFTSVITSSDGRTSEDYVKFNFVSIDTPDDELTVDEDTTKVTINYAATVKILDLTIYDQDGKVVGDFPGYVVKNPETGGSDIVPIDLSGLDLAKGKYTVKVTAYDTYDRAGGAVGSVTVWFNYVPESPNVPVTPDAPNVPDTGALLSSLNISKSDFLITGLIGFTAISVLALFVIKRTNKRK